jgi:hypothetical protein
LQQRSKAQRAAGHRSNTLRGPARCRPSQQRSKAQRAVAHRNNTLRGPAHYWPSQQHREVQRVAAAAPEERCKLQCVAGQRRNNAASCNVPGHRCSVTRSCSVAPPPAITATAVELHTSHVRLSSDFLRTSVGRPSNFRPSNSCPTFVGRPSNFRSTSSPASLLTSLYCRHASCMRHC